MNLRDFLIFIVGYLTGTLLTLLMVVSAMRKEK